jgi:thioredoxin
MTRDRVWAVLVCFSGWALVATGGSAKAAVQNSRYLFQAGQAAVVQTGGFAGVHRTYSVTGQFLLAVDRAAGIASFVQVDANAIDDSPYNRTLDVNQVFDMTSLRGTVVDDTTLSFMGMADNGSLIQITATLQGEAIRLAGQTTPPANSADYFLFSLDAVGQRKYGGGAGDPNDPYRIATAADLITLGQTPGDYDRHFTLTTNIDLDPNLAGQKVFDNAVIAADVNQANEAWRFDGTGFSGVFDGNEHTISNLTIKGKGTLGLFGVLASSAEVRDLGVVDVNIVGSCDRIGGLAGSNGWMAGTPGGRVTRCYSTGIVRGSGSVGGLVGANLGTLDSCYAQGTVSGSTGVGGLLGSNDVILTTSGPVAGKVRRCYSTAGVTGLEAAGGLVGNNGCVDIGKQDPTLACAEVTASFWDAQTSGQAASAGGAGKGTAEMQTAGTFLAAGWDFVGETANGTADLWRINEGKDYPRFWWQAAEAVRLPVVELDLTSFDTQIARGVILVDFYATWCPHCTAQAPVLEEVADRLLGRAGVGKLDIDKVNAVAKRYSVTAIPTLIVFQDGIAVKRFVGETSADVLVSAILAAVDSLGNPTQ